MVRERHNTQTHTVFLPILPEVKSKLQQKKKGIKQITITMSLLIFNKRTTAVIRHKYY